MDERLCRCIWSPSHVILPLAAPQLQFLFESCGRGQVILKVFDKIGSIVVICATKVLLMTELTKLAFTTVHVVDRKLFA